MTTASSCNTVVRPFLRLRVRLPGLCSIRPGISLRKCSQQQGEWQRYRAAHLAAAEGGLVVAAAQVAGLVGDAVVHVLGETVQHTDRPLAQADVRVDLLQHPVDVDLRAGTGASGPQPHASSSNRLLFIEQPIQ